MEEKGTSLVELRKVLAKLSDNKEVPLFVVQEPLVEELESSDQYPNGRVQFAPEISEDMRKKGMSPFLEKIFGPTRAKKAGITDQEREEMLQQ